jgi:hypothetical protein
MVKDKRILPSFGFSVATPEDPKGRRAEGKVLFWNYSK